MTIMKTGTIYYGFGKEYLSNWGINEALREVYQNFIDYGEYSATEESVNSVSLVNIQNNWEPENLDFLRIGKSVKQSDTAIGKHGEGLKMAFMIFLRSGFSSSILASKYKIWPEWYVDEEIGECFCLKYELHEQDKAGFEVTFECPTGIFTEFIDNIIEQKDVIFDDKYFGQIVEKQKGKIYSGGIFVANVDNLSASYNINPKHLELDRDRRVPGSFDVNYSTSKIKEAYGKTQIKDLSYSDTMYIDKLPLEVKEQIKPKKVGDSIEFTFKDDDGKTNVIHNQRVIKILREDSFFEGIIKRLKMAIAKKLGLYDMLVEFEKKHLKHVSVEAKQDFALILDKIDKTK